MPKFPLTWKSTRLADAATWLSGGTPSTSNRRLWDGDIPWISASSLKSFDLTDSERRVTALGALSGSRVVPPGTTLLIIRGMSLKTEVRVGIAARELAFGQDCKALIPAPGIHPRFLTYAIAAQEDQILRMVDEAGNGTGRLPSDQLRELQIGIPPIAEQRKIVEILDSVDESIRTTERLIAKKYQIRTGLVVNLLAALEVGGASTSPISSLGKNFAPTLRTGPFGSLLKGSDWCETGTPVITIGSLGVGEIYNDELLHISEKKADLLSNYRVAEGDIVFSRVADVGRSVVIDRSQQGWVMSSNLLCISVDKNKVLPEYLQLALSHSPVLRSQIRGKTNSGGRDVVSVGVLGSLQIRLPTASGQMKVAKAATQSQAEIKILQAQLSNQLRLKVGLMHDLLMGRVHVNAGEGFAA